MGPTHWKSKRMVNNHIAQPYRKIVLKESHSSWSIHIYPEPSLFSEVINNCAQRVTKMVHALTYIVKCESGWIFSIGWVPSPVAHSTGGLIFVSWSSLNPVNRCINRTRKNVASWYANCCPRQIRGPALNGQKMKGLGTRYLCNLSSRNRSGSNFRAAMEWRWVIGSPDGTINAYHLGPIDQFYDGDL